MVASNTLPLTMKYIYSHPEVVSKIRAELEHIPGHVKISDLVHQEGVCALPYLEATILEALRLAPSFGIPLSRAVPSTGCQLDQFFVPPGNNVSMSAWTVNTSTEYFGPDAHQFRPERWIGNHPTEMAKDGSGNPRTMRNYLEAGWITFGAGSRVCIGRHLSMIAFMKFVGEMVRNFELEINKEPYLWYGLIQHSEEMIVTARVIPSSPLIAMKAN
jgi:cytochrome P450